MKQFKYITYAVIALSVIFSCNRNTTEQQEQQQEQEPQHTILYGIIADDYKIENNDIRINNTTGDRYNLNKIRYVRGISNYN